MSSISRRGPYTGQLPRHNYDDDNRLTTARPRWSIASLFRPRCRRILRWVVLGVLTLIGLGYWIWEPHIELAFYRRRWIASDVLAVQPLAGCFDPARLSAPYNASLRAHPYAPDVHPGIPLPTGHDCYAFARTVHAPPAPPPDADAEPVLFHTYWRTDLAPFGPRQEQFLKSFFATQPTPRAKLVLWSNGDLAAQPLVKAWLARLPFSFETRVARAPDLAAGTALDGSPLLRSADARAWIDGDLVRLLVLWAYGGVWVDMDTLITRDLTPLLGHEFVTQWDCYNKPYSPFNGALMRFHTHSPYLCEAFHIMARSPPPRPGTTDWGSLLYLKLFRALLQGGAAPFKVLPWCFSEGRSCRLDNRLPDPFASDDDAWRWDTTDTDTQNTKQKNAKPGLHDVLDSGVFAVHLHNQWDKAFPKGGWVERLLLARYDRTLHAHDT